MPFREQLCRYLPPPLSDAVHALQPQEAERLEDIRIYAGRHVEFVFSDDCRITDIRFDGPMMDNLLAALCGYALYGYEQQMAEGFIPLAGGHRAGVCGRMVYKDGQWNMSEILSVCIRISHDMRGASRAIRPYLIDSDGVPRRVLLLGPPGCGKTTVLRDAARWMAEEKHLRVAVADEREELFGTRPGPKVHVLCGADKARMLRMLLRSMAPQVMVTDEIGGQADTEVLMDTARCGVGLVASAHAQSMQEAIRRPVLRDLFDGQVFDRYLMIGFHGSLLGVCDRDGKEMEESGHGKLGCGGNGDDCNQRNRFSAFRWRTAAGALDSGDAPLPAADQCHHPL